MIKYLFSAAILLFSLSVQAQKKTVVSGRVTDTESKPVAGLAIFVDGTNTGRATNVNGFFKVKVKPGSRMLGIYQSDEKLGEKPITPRGDYNFVIVPAKDASDGNKQVNIGYGARKEKEVTESVNSFEKGNENFHYNNIYDMLMTQPDLIVNGKNIFVRGTSTIANNPPLILVDDMPVTDLDGIIPRSVKSIEILKGAAASIYGVQGGAGVILITTKK